MPVKQWNFTKRSRTNALSKIHRDVKKMNTPLLDIRLRKTLPLRTINHLKKPAKSVIAASLDATLLTRQSAILKDKFPNLLSR